MTEIKVTYLAPASEYLLEKTYLEVREKEGWLYSDDSVRLLPSGGFKKEHQQIWRWRQRSLHRLIFYIRQQFKAPIQILDLGCGNGWMSHALASALPHAQVWACDINQSELEQGNRVFQLPNLRFYFADIEKGHLPADQFDLVVMAGVFQYFADATGIQEQLHRVLKKGGESHIIDTNFYHNQAKRHWAQAQSTQYFETLGRPEMAQFYHHHLMENLNAVDFNRGFFTRILQKIKYLSPFPWLVFRKN
jgi:ubiquinone/menaquinone biosynthesis C-methylase UbiE